MYVMLRVDLRNRPWSIFREHVEEGELDWRSDDRVDEGNYWILDNARKAMPFCGPHPPLPHPSTSLSSNPYLPPSPGPLPWIVR